MIDPSMMLPAGLLGGGLLVGFWGYVKSFFYKFISFFWVTIEIGGNSGDLTDALQSYVRDNFKEGRLNEFYFKGAEVFVRPKNRRQLVGYIDFPEQSTLYWKGWIPIWFKFKPRDDNKGTENKVAMSFVRGTFDSKKLIIDCINDYNHKKQNNKCRYRVQYIYGSNQEGNVKGDRAPSNFDEDGDWFKFVRLLSWKPDELGTKKSIANAYVIFSKNIKDSIEEAQFWKDSEFWYTDKGIPWRRGWLLHGKPGTGKTSLARMLAEELDLPVFVYDLASLSNEELRMQWSQMTQEAPCMALIEDIDSVFDGRKNLNKTNGKKSTLTFDCLLNCLDGIELSNGLFTIITTNNLEKIDPALAGYGKETRPGRIDRIIEVPNPPRTGLEELCKRILRDWPDIWEEVVNDGVVNNDTMAQFSERCTRIALGLHWKNFKK